LKEVIGLYNPGSGHVKIGASTLKSTKAFTFIPQIDRYDIEVVGAGSDGVLIFSHKDIDFSKITEGFAKTMSVPLINKSDCSLYI
jgi:hypothetical protein